MCNSSFITLNYESFCKKKFEIDAQGQKCQHGKMAIFCQIAILALLSLCIDFKIFYGKMTFGWVIWKSYYTLFLKKCLRPCPGLSMYLSERMNWNISSFPWWISKILFVLGSCDHFGSLGCGIRQCPFFCCLTTWKKHCVPFSFRLTLWLTMWTAKAKICSTLAFELFLKLWPFL